MTIEKRLERQGAKFEFKDGKVKAFSYITQHNEYDSLQEAINDICELDEKYNGKTFTEVLIETILNRSLYEL